MYRRPKFLEILDEVRQKMSREADYDVDLFAEMIRRGQQKKQREKGEEFLTFHYNPQEDLAPKTKR
ncbi:MAG: hypothetical protein HC846_09480 [Blastocatellia bacterium]|nr:hypothetical protein [Blastocatellia bacterium]